jgi:hypothetical protein
VTGRGRVVAQYNVSQLPAGGHMVATKCCTSCCCCFLCYSSAAAAFSGPGKPLTTGSCWWLHVRDS